MIGSSVLHPFFGKGKVINQRFRGMQLQIEFDKGPVLWVRRDVLNVIKEIKKEGKETFPIKVSPIKYGNFESRKLIEAFRLGIVPHLSIDDFTFGREKELQKAKEELSLFKENKGGVLILEGEYGSGKTHLLNYLHCFLLKSGYAVGRVELDPFDVSPFRPKHMYREIIRSLRLRTDKEELNFQDIILKARDIYFPKSHIFFSKAISFLKSNNKELDILWDWISGETLSRDYLNFCKYWRLPVLLDHTPAVDIYCYLLSGWGYILKQIGAKGFVIIIDEAETLFHLWYRAEYGFYFYQGLIKLAQNDPSLTQLVLENKDRGSSYVGKIDRFGLMHSGMRSLPYSYEIPNYIFLILALTPSFHPYYEKICSLLGKDKIIQLSPLSREDIKKMLERLIELYEEAFPPFRLVDKLKRDLFHKLIVLKGREIRFLIKSGVYWMDLYRHYGEEKRNIFVDTGIGL